MGNKVAKIIKLKAKEFNKLTSVLLAEGSYAWLLKKAGMADTYERIFEIRDYYYEYKDFRGQTLVKVATQDSLFVAALYQASDVTINGQVYQIENRDIIPPDANRPWWEFYCTMTNNTFTEADLP